MDRQRQTRPPNTQTCRAVRSTASSRTVCGAFVHLHLSIQPPFRRVHTEGRQERQIFSRGRKVSRAAVKRRKQGRGEHVH
eukprot:6850446-Prorocentrum_lima.AAC.1